MTRRLLCLCLGTICLAHALGGCQEEPPPPPPSPPVQKVAPKAAASQAAPQAVEPAAPPKYVYDPAGLRDPFEPLLSVKKPLSEVDPTIPLTPLQKYDLEQLRLIGVVLVKPQPIAMVVAPDGKSYILKKGVKIGKNNGAVIDVTSEAVIVQEQYIDISGEVRTNLVEIKLPKKEGV